MIKMEYDDKLNVTTVQQRNFGFIITRHVNSIITNKYWNQCVKLIRTHYPFSKIVIIDDDSVKFYVKTEFNYANVTIIESEYPKRGELLPYIYFLKYRWFANAIIMHDSIFIHKRIPFEKMKHLVLPLWHCPCDTENLPNIIRIASLLTNSNIVIDKITDTPVIKLIKHNDNILCFGVQTYISLQFLDLLEHKYTITNLIHAVHNRSDRCVLERIFGTLFCLEYPKLLLYKSLFGNIHNFPNAFKYTYHQYLKDLQKHKTLKEFVKVWTGR